MKTVTIRVLSGCTALFVACVITAVASAQTQTIRVVTYNIEADNGGYTNARPGLITPSSGGTVTNGGVLEGIGEEILGSDPAQPIDILALQETTSNSTTVQPIVDGLNAFYSFHNVAAGYAMSTYQATENGGNPGSGNGPNALVYNTNTVQLIASVPVDPAGGISNLGSHSGEFREVMRYELAPAGVTPTTNNEFYIYVSHYKSGTDTSDLTDRTGESGIIRTNSASLPSDARVLYVGDYNVSTSTETSYQNIVSTTLEGIQGIDPFNVQGLIGYNWTANYLLSYKTESSTSLHYRDDFQVMSSNVYYGVAGGLAYVPGTYHTFGNNGSTPYMGSTTASGNTALNTNLMASPWISAAQIRTNLTTASDHLPVMADYTILPSCSPPTNDFIAVPTLGPAPLSVTFTDLTTGTVASNYTDFSDGGWTNNLLPPTNFVHQYTSPGTYLVTNIEWGCGSVCTSYVTITVCTPPGASFTANTTIGPPNLQVIFTDTSTGTINNVTWTFGDGNWTNFPTTTPTPVTNTYTTGGHYSVTQIVDSASCGISTNGQPNLIWVYTPWEIWQNQYFGCIGCQQAAGDVDADGDGISNTNEFLAGTDPTNSMSALRITSVVRQAGTNIVITWTAVGGNSYVVQTNAPAANGSYTNNFADLSGTITVPGNGGDTTAVYTNWAGATNIPSLYYRIRLVP